eukprot:3940364-Rhodomonas_salina.2
MTDLAYAGSTDLVHAATATDLAYAAALLTSRMLLRLPANRRIWLHLRDENYKAGEEKFGYEDENRGFKVRALRSAIYKWSKDQVKYRNPAPILPAPLEKVRVSDTAVCTRTVLSAYGATSCYAASGTDDPPGTDCPPGTDDWYGAVPGPESGSGVREPR